MMHTAPITHLITLPPQCMDTMDTGIMNHGMAAITDIVATADIDIMVTTGEEDTHIMAAVDIDINVWDQDRAHNLIFGSHHTLGDQDLKDVEGEDSTASVHPNMLSSRSLSGISLS